jgi:predicted transcriptional regulator
MFWECKLVHLKVRDKKYLNLKLTNFQIMTHVLIQSVKGIVKNKNMDFLRNYNWQVLCWIIMSFFTKQQLSKFPFQ